MPMDGLTPVQIKLLSMLADSMFGIKITCGDVPPGEVLREATKQGVFLISAGKAELGNVDDEHLKIEIRNLVNTSLVRTLLVANGHSEISSLLESNGIPHTIIKGLATSEWYADPELRVLGDVDFFVAPADVERAEKLLISNGYTPEKLSHNIHHVFLKDSCRFELHFNVPGVPEGEPGERCRKYFDDIIEKSEIRDTKFGPMRLPSPFHHGLILILHTAHHLTNSGIGLRQLCDWSAFAAGINSDSKLSGKLCSALRDIGLLRFAEYLTGIAERYLGCPEGCMPSVTDDEISRDLLLDMFAGGNLGQGEITRSREAYLITSGRSDSLRIKRLASTLTEMVNQKWPLTRSVKPLVPVGLAYYSVVYFYLSARGRRPKLKALKALRGAEARSKLYDKLELFNNRT